MTEFMNFFEWHLMIMRDRLSLRNRIKLNSNCRSSESVTNQGEKSRCHMNQWTFHENSDSAKCFTESYWQSADLLGKKQVHQRIRACRVFTGFARIWLSTARCWLLAYIFYPRCITWRAENTRFRLQVVCIIHELRIRSAFAFLPSFFRAAVTWLVGCINSTLLDTWMLVSLQNGLTATAMDSAIVRINKEWIVAITGSWRTSTYWASCGIVRCTSRFSLTTNDGRIACVIQWTPVNQLTIWRSRTGIHCIENTRSLFRLVLSCPFLAAFGRNTSSMRVDGRESSHSGRRLNYRKAGVVYRRTGCNERVVECSESRMSAGGKWTADLTVGGDGLRTVWCGSSNRPRRCIKQVEDVRLDHRTGSTDLDSCCSTDLQWPSGSRRVVRLLSEWSTIGRAERVRMRGLRWTTDGTARTDAVRRPRIERSVSALRGRTSSCRERGSHFTNVAPLKTFERNASSRNARINRQSTTNTRGHINENAE